MTIDPQHGCVQAGTNGVGEHRGDPLTVEQIRQLPDGAEVTITWCNGNGPHGYRVLVDHRGDRRVENSQDDLILQRPEEAVRPAHRVTLGWNDASRRIDAVRYVPVSVRGRRERMRRPAGTAATPPDSWNPCATCSCSGHCHAVCCHRHAEHCRPGELCCQACPEQWHPEHPASVDCVRADATQAPLPTTTETPVTPADDDYSSLIPYERPAAGSKPELLIIDLDGTLAKRRDGGRGPYEEHRVLEDEVNEPVMRTAIALATQRPQLRVMFVSARKEQYRHLTEAWLHANWPFRYVALLMRPDGDTRRDWRVKADLFDKHVRGEYDVFVVFDDRNQVVKMWRALGLTVFQVADGNF